MPTGQGRQPGTAAGPGPIRLGDQDSDACAFDPGAHGHPDDRQEHDVEPAIAEHERQGGENGGNLQQALGRDPQHAAALPKDQRERRHGRDADHVADRIAQHIPDEIRRRHQSRHDHRSDISRSHQPGANDVTITESGDRAAIAEPDRSAASGAARTAPPPRRRRQSGAPPKPR